VPQGSVLSPTLYSLYIHDAPQILGVYLSLFAGDTCIYAADRKEGYVLRKLQRGLSAVGTWFERWNVKMNEDKTNSVYYLVLLITSQHDRTENTVPLLLCLCCVRGPSRKHHSSVAV
jgi:hypothetical protein